MPLIRQGQLIVPFKAGLVSEQTYALFTPLEPGQDKAARRFELWLRQAVATYQSTILEELSGLGIRVIARTAHPA
jgi:LysR family glycine cleavage system transcriptional activator/LysR family transcriptional regulator of beta-lactamase